MRADGVRAEQSLHTSAQKSQHGHRATSRGPECRSLNRSPPPATSCKLSDEAVCSASVSRTILTTPGGREVHL